jgi:hypothetical protein
MSCLEECGPRLSTTRLRKVCTIDTWLDPLNAQVEVPIAHGVVTGSCRGRRGLDRYSARRPVSAAGRNREAPQMS